MSSSTPPSSAGSTNLPPDLQALRAQIDVIDRAIVAQLNERVKLACAIGRIKAERGAEWYVPSREEEVFDRVARYSDGPLDAAALRAIYREVMSAATALQNPLTVAYLGPEATYTHQAAMRNFGSAVRYTPVHGIDDVFLAVERGEAHYGVIPIENSTEGAVHHSLDRLVESPLKVIAQIYLEISHCLISPHPLEKITTVLSKDNALAQCRGWLSRMLPRAALVEMASTSHAVRRAREEAGAAAIASRLAAELYGVPVVADRIQDRTDNTTRFFVLGRQVSPPLGNQHDRTSLVFSLKDEVGALMAAMRQFSDRGLNLAKIESRPSRQKPWDYYFFADVIAHASDPAMQDALAGLEKICPMVKWLGSYPATH